MDQDRITQAQIEYAELLKFSILQEEAILHMSGEITPGELTRLREAHHSKYREREELFMKKYADLILQGVTFHHNINVISSNHSL
jgi:hypothetical protein